LSDLLDTIPTALAVTRSQRKALVSSERALPGFGNEFWEAAEASTLTKPQVGALRTTVALARLADGDLDLVRALQQRLPVEPDGGLTHLATLTPNEWISIAAEARPNGSMSEIERAAGNLGEAIELQYSSLTFKTKLDRGVVHVDGFPSAKVAKFLGTHPDFDLKGTAIEQFYIERGLEDAELKKALLDTQRVLSLGATQTEAIEVMRAGLTSAQAIFATGLSKVNVVLGDRIDQMKIAELYGKAHQVVSATLGVASIVAPAFIGPAIPALGSPGVSEALLTRFPSLGVIFGDPSARTCSHCGSVLGPAAYLVDLLNTLSRAGAEAPLRERRPDIAQLELTCENTNTELPYADLVLETLENAITFPTGPITLTADQQDQLDAGSVPDPVRSQLAATVSSLQGGITLVNAAELGSLQAIAVVQGHRRWPAQRTLERVTVTPVAGAAAAAANELDISQRDVVLHALRQGTAAPQLIALLAPPEPLLPVSGTPAVTRLQLQRGPFNDGLESYRVDVIRQVIVTVRLPSVGVLEFQRPDGTPIKTIGPLSVGLAQMIFADLKEGRLSRFIANLLPPGSYQVRPVTGATGQWPMYIVSAEWAYEVTYDPGRLILTGLAFTGSSSASADLTVFAENRNPAAYIVLAGTFYPWSLPFDVFTEEVRACLAAMGVTRLDLIRALRPELGNASVLDACEVLHTTPGQIEQLTGPDPAAGPSALWGLTATGNVLSEPSGDTGGPPIPGDWISALSRLSVLLQRSRVELATLLGALASRYVTGGAVPVLQPPTEDKPSRLDVQGLTEPMLTRLHRFLRLRLITGWSLHDLDVSLGAVTNHFTTPLTEGAVEALAALDELAARLDVPLRQAASWLGALETRPFTDRETAGEPVLPSLYDETFVRTRRGRTPDQDFALDANQSELTYITDQRAAGIDPPVLKALTDKIPDLSSALHIKPAEVSALIAALPPVFKTVFGNIKLPVRDDRLTFGNLAALARYSTFAQALGLAIPEYLLLRSLTGEDLFPTAPNVAPYERARRLLQFCELADEIRASGFTLDQLAEAVGAAALDPAAQRERSLDLLRALADLQAGLRAATAPRDSHDSETGIRNLLSAAGWPSGATDKIILGDAGSIGLNAAVDVQVSVKAKPILPAGLPFTLEPGASLGESVIVAQLEALATADAAARFAELAAVAGLGPLTDANSPAAQLKAAWDALQKRILRLAAWLQSIDLPISRTPFIFTRAVPPALGDSTARLRYDPAARELVLAGYLDKSEQAAYSAFSEEPHFAEAVQALAGQADGYVEPRSGSRLLTTQAVRDLILRQPSPVTRYAAVAQAAARPSRRRVLARLAAEQFTIDPLLFSALDDAAQLASPPKDVLAQLCSDDFASADLHSGSIPASWLAVVAALRRVGMLTSALRVHSSELAWFDAASGFTGLAQLGFGPWPDMVPNQRFMLWRRAAALYRLRASVPGQAATLEAIRVAAVKATAPDDVLTLVERAYQLPAGSVAALRLDGMVSRPADLLDPLLLQRVAHAARTLRHLGATAAVAISLCQETLTESHALAARGLFAGKYGPQAASDGLRAAMNALRERQRSALVDYLIQREGAVDAADLHARYLLDVEMGVDMRTSRIKQAISSTQLFVQRWLMNLESAELPAPSAEFASAWEWTRSYRVWEANRKVFLFPEDWLEPSLRDDKSHLFTAFESTLLQSEVTTERAVEALRGYLDGLQEISQITVLAMYYETMGPRASTVYVVGKTADYPAKYLYRRWWPLGAVGSWEPWEPIDVISNTDHIVVFIRNGRPHIAWLEIDDANSRDLAASTGCVTQGADPSSMWALQLQWSQRGQEGWSAPKKSSNKVTHYKRINKSARTTFALRLEGLTGGGPVIRCYGGSEDTAQPGPGPSPWQPTPDVATSKLPKGQWVEHPIHVQVLGKIGTLYWPLSQAVIEMWGVSVVIATGSGEQVRLNLGTPAQPFSVPNHDGVGTTSLKTAQWMSAPGSTLSVTVRVRYTGAPQQPPPQTASLSPDELNDVRFSFVVDLDKAPSTSVDPKINPDRHLRLFPIATADWGLGRALRWRCDAWQPTKELLLPDGAEHYSSGYRFPPNTPVEIQGVTIFKPGGPEPVFVAAAARDDGPGIGLPFYAEAESASSSGFVTQGMNSGAFTFIPATEITHMVVQRALDREIERVELPSAPSDPAVTASANVLSPDTKLATPYDRRAPQFDRALPYAGYVWEIFFHAPIMIAHGLATHQRYGEALRWLHTTFNPTATDGKGQRHWWQFQPFADAGQGVGIDVLLKNFSIDRLDAEQQTAIHAQLDFSRTSPFRPHGIARMRIRAYQWMVVLKYLDILIAWGDQQFRRDSIESINEATQLYLLAAELLGRRPTQLPPRPMPAAPPTFASLARWDDFANASLSLADTPFFKALLAYLTYLVQHGMGPGSSAFDSALRQLSSLLSMERPVFCIPRNERLDQYWDIVEDRLFKIRRSQDIDGVQRRLALFEPPIDPALLVRAVAAGLDISSALSEVFAPPTPYRFNMVLQQAEEFCAEVKALGATLLSALEKRDAEDLARLRSTQELDLLGLVGDFKRRQLDEAEANFTALRQSRQTAELRYRHYQRLLGKEQIQTPQPNDPVEQESPRLQLARSTSDRVDADLRGYGLTLEEADHLGWLTVGNSYTLIGGSFQTAAGIAHIFPNLTIGSPGPTATFGGANVGNALGAIAQFFNLLAANASFQSSRSSIIAGHQRRYDDWILQSNLAGKEIEQIDKQILAAEIRVDLANREIRQHDKQVQTAKSIDEFLHEKFTASELYQWMVDRLAEVHTSAYHLAYDLARRAQRAFTFELGGGDPGIITFGSWDGLHRGLLAGERLSLDLKRLKSAYAERNQRELEITKRVSLNELDPIALLRLQTTGSCEFAIPELVFDLDFPGHYFRRIKTVAVSVPCVAGPYTTVAGTLTLLENRLRASPIVPRGAAEPDYRRDIVPVQSVAISAGSADSGMFELNFHDERYLWFEGAGAISRWRFELPAEFRAFDYKTISDLVLQIRYTARDGGAVLKTDATFRVRNAMTEQSARITTAGEEGRLVRAFSLRHDFAAEWARLIGPPAAPQTISVGLERFPFLASDRTIEIWKVSLYLRGTDITAGTDPPMTVQAPSAAYTNTEEGKPPPAIPWEQVDVSDGAGLYEFNLEGEDWTPVTVKTGQAPTWTLKLPEPAPALSDAVLAFWWRLTSPQNQP
jgi:hypothetical protein